MSDIYGIAKSGLKAYKEGLATTGQNIANVGNAAYARREAPVSEVTSGKDILQVSNTAGFGVRVDGITRAFDQFIETQLQSASSGFSFSTAQATVLNQLETVVRPAEGSVSQKIQELFSSLNSVAQDPSDLASRQVAANASMALVNSITTVANGISDLRTFVSQDLESNVGQVNNVLDQLANIQNQLLGISSSNRGPNELLDKRDALLNDLSELMDISVAYEPNGLLEVNAGTFGQGQSLISGVQVSKLEVQKVDDTSKIFMRSANGDGLSKIQVKAGKIAGNLASDFTLVETKSALDQLSRKLVSEFNEAHTFGVDLNGELGGEFFSLDGVKVEKQNSVQSTSQISLSGKMEKFLGQKLEIDFSAAEEIWTLKNDRGNELGKFKDFLEGITGIDQDEPFASELREKLSNMEAGDQPDIDPFQAAEGGRVGFNNGGATGMSSDEFAKELEYFFLNPVNEDWPNIKRLIKAKINFNSKTNKLTVDFSQSSKMLKNNFNTPTAVTKSVVIYFLRTLIEDNLPLNEGALKDIEIRFSASGLFSKPVLSCGNGSGSVFAFLIFCVIFSAVSVNMILE